MTENNVTGEYEIRGGAWELLFVLLFYAGATMTMMGTFGVVPVVLVPIGLPLALFSIFTIASSPTYLLTEGCALILERTRFLPGLQPAHSPLRRTRHTRHGVAPFPRLAGRDPTGQGRFLFHLRGPVDRPGAGTGLSFSPEQYACR